MKKEMKMKIASILLSKHMLKVHALMLGFLIWSTISQNYIVTKTQTVALSFYNQPKNTRLYAPETVTITSFGPKNHLDQVFHSGYAVHIDLQDYQLGTHDLNINADHLFLPPTIKLLQLSPRLIQIKIAQ